MQTQHLSIKQLLNKSDEVSQNSTQDYSNRPNTPFNIDQVKMVWKQFAFKMKDEGKDSVYYALTKRDPKIFNENEIHQEVDNLVQTQTIQDELSVFQEFVRTKLNNWSVQLFFDVIKEQEEKDIRQLNGKDRFEALAKKNSNLHSFLKTFNLDIDY
ncbi:MAG: hypothetical protein ACK5B9_06875 [Flavobacteriia bacterium]